VWFPPATTGDDYLREQPFKGPGDVSFFYNKLTPTVFVKFEERKNTDQKI
jgi:hypothetical protein